MSHEDGPRASLSATARTGVCSQNPLGAAMTPAQYRNRLVGSIGAKGTSAFGWTVIRLDPVSVRIDDEGSVVIGTVNRAQTGRTVVLPT